MSIGALYRINVDFESIVRRISDLNPPPNSREIIFHCTFAQCVHPNSKRQSRARDNREREHRSTKQINFRLQLHASGKADLIGDSINDAANWARTDTTDRAAVSAVAQLTAV